MKEPKRIESRIKDLKKIKKEFDEEPIINRQELKILNERINTLEWVLNCYL